MCCSPGKCIKYAPISGHCKGARPFQKGPGNMSPPFTPSTGAAPEVCRKRHILMSAPFILSARTTSNSVVVPRLNSCHDCFSFSGDLCGGLHFSPRSQDEAALVCCKNCARSPAREKSLSRPGGVRIMRKHRARGRCAPGDPGDGCLPTTSSILSQSRAGISKVAMGSCCVVADAFPSFTVASHRTRPPESSRGGGLYWQGCALTR